MNDISRRQALLNFLFGASGVGLRALATGIPAAILMNPEKALAADGVDTPTCADHSKAQYIIMSTSANGDPSGCNIPGTYDDPKILHSTATTMAPTALTLSGKSTKAAAPWATLPQATLDRTVFFHHGTYTVVHGDEPKTLTLSGAVANNEMLVSLLSSQLAACLGCVQAAPIAVSGGGGLGSEALSYKGRVQPVLTPAALASVLTLPAGPLANLQKLRDSTLDSLNAWYKTKGTPGQQSFIDRYANSQAQLRTVGGSLLGNLANIKDNSPASQMLAATVLIQMNIAPVISVHVPFGGDNHGDSGFSAEAGQTVTALQTINSMLTNLSSSQMQDKVTFMILNVFGRTMASSFGRDHNGNHHGAVLIGKNLKGGIIGGVAARGGDFGATGIDSATGASNDAGDIPFLDTFSSMGKTLGAAVGIDSAYLDTNITGGKVVKAALV